MDVTSGPVYTAYGIEEDSAHSTGTWYHLVVTYDRSSYFDGIKFYVDGVRQTMIIGSNIIPDIAALTYPAVLGKLLWFGSLYFDGKLDDVRFYNQTLSQDEINALYNSGTGLETELTSYFHYLSQGNNSYNETFFDTKFKDATTTTATWNTGTKQLTFTSGQIGQSISIDYKNDTITQAKILVTSTSGSFTYYLSANGGVDGKLLQIIFLIHLQTPEQI